jgi:branched-chain amino acid transport system substrate-binding protein
LYVKNFFKEEIMIMKRVMTCLLFLVCALMIVTYSVSAAAEQEEVIKIGAIYPLTGSVASLGINCQRGAMFAVDEINSKGGILGKKLVIEYGDSTGDPKIGMSEAERLITQKNVSALLGCYQSAVTVVVAQVAQKYKVPMITAISTADTITSKGYNYFFRLSPTNMMYLRDMVQIIIDYNQKYGTNMTRAAVMAENTLNGQESAKWAKYWGEQMGLEMVDEIMYSHNAADLTSEVLTLKSQDPDIVFIDPYISDAILLVKTMHEQQFKPKIIVSKASGVIDPDFLPAVGEQGYGISTCVEWSEDFGKGIEISDAFEERFGVAMNGHSAEVYTALWVLKTAIEKAGEPDTEKIQSSLENLKIDKEFPDGPIIILPYDTIEFSNIEMGGTMHTNQNTYARVSIAQILEEKYKTIWPFDVAITEMQIPVWE